LWKCFVDTICVLLDGTIKRTIDCLSMVNLDFREDFKNAFDQADKGSLKQG